MVLVLNYDGGIKSGINEKTKKLLENHEFDFTTWYLPCVYSNSYELDSLKMTQFLNTISQKNIDLVFNDVEAMFFVESYAKAMNLDWNCKHVVQLFDIKREL